ncbi:MAG TPA: GNAT family N-acetyltransferase [Solirubrobacterales bacterium]|jgi:ribosomal protein S18 acetylase RimI-like enzyme
MLPSQDGPPEVEIVEATAARLDEIESLWQAMHAHDAEVAERAREVVPFRDGTDSWRRRRDEFERWMKAGDAWLLIAEHDGTSVGFALFRVGEGDWGFQTDERIGELEALSVEPELRRWGIGSLLMEEVERRLIAAGIDHIGLDLVAGNADALRFYERWGVTPTHVRCLGPTIRGA